VALGYAGVRPLPNHSAWRRRFEVVKIHPIQRNYWSVFLRLPNLAPFDPHPSRRPLLKSCNVIPRILNLTRAVILYIWFSNSPVDKLMPRNDWDPFIRKYDKDWTCRRLKRAWQVRGVNANCLERGCRRAKALQCPGMPTVFLVILCRQAATDTYHLSCSSTSQLSSDVRG
jgi:hypothetical protein